MFKTNSRFAALAEDIKSTDNYDNRSKDNKGTNNHDNRTTDNRTTDNRRPERNYNSGQGVFENNKDYIKRKALEQTKKEEENKKLEIEKLTKILEDPNSFPDLLGTKQNTTSQINYTSFSEKLKNNLKNETETEIDNDKSNNEKDKIVLNPGWIQIIRDPKTGKKSIISNYIDKKPEVKNDSDYGMAVLTALCDLHERRTQEHIDRYGYDAWERSFRDPYYDYEYFDRMDEEYEEEMEKEREREIRELEDDEDDDETDYDKYNNYWKH